jgi:hypothetical protein
MEVFSRLTTMSKLIAMAQGHQEDGRLNEEQ